MIDWSVGKDFRNYLIVFFFKLPLNRLHSSPSLLSSAHINNSDRSSESEELLTTCVLWKIAGGKGVRSAQKRLSE